MSPQVFYRKWRPQALNEVAGQEHVTQTLLQALATGRVSHAYLFSGPRGTGKTSTGRILAKAVNCLTNGHGEPCNQCAVCQSITQGNSMDVVEVDAASNRGIDDIRSLREKVAFVPGSARYKVYIIDEVHMLSEPAANALLKTLEEPPPHVIFILATTDPHKMPATILSRCQHFQFHRLTQTAVSTRLAFVCEKEGITAPPEALHLIARSSTGSLRDAENLLEQTVAYYGSRLELAQVKELLGLSGDLRARELARNVLEKNLSAGLAAINEANSDGLDLRQFLRSLVDYLRGLLLLKAGASDAVEVTPEEMADMKPLAEASPLDSILQAVKLFSQIDMRMDNYSTLPLELALVECIIPRDDTPVEAQRAARQQPIAMPVSRPATPRPSQAPARINPPQRETPLPKPEPTVSTNTPAILPKVKEPIASTSREQASRQVGTSADPPPDGASAVPITPSRQVGTGQAPTIVSPGATTGASPMEAFSTGSPNTPAESRQVGITPPPPGTPPLDYLRQHWREFINSLRGEGSTGTLDTLLRSACEPVAIDGDHIVLGFYWSFHKEKIEDPKYCFLIERKLNQFMGGAYKLRCVLTEKKQSRNSSSVKKSPGYLIEAALQEGGRIINVEEK